MCIIRLRLLFSYMQQTMQVKMGHQLFILLYHNQTKPVRFMKARGSSESIFICCLPWWTHRPAGFSQGGMYCEKYGCESFIMWCLLMICQGSHAVWKSLIEKVLNCENSFQDLEKVLILTKMYIKYWKSMEIPNAAICLFKFC